MNPLGGDPRQRIKKQDTIIKGGDKDLTLHREEVTQFFPDGSVETTETVISEIIGAERIYAPMQIVGKCEICQRLVTIKSARNCQCGLVLCVNCSKLWEGGDDRRNVCPRCYKKLRRQRFFRVLLSPFVEKRENGTS
jgi:hypothetical protein